MQRHPVLVRRRRIAAAAVALSLTAPLAAAPVGSADGAVGSAGGGALGADDEGGPSANPGGRALRDASGALRLPDRSVLAEQPATPKTIDLLLEMQGRNPGLAGGERSGNQELPPPRPAPDTNGGLDATRRLEAPAPRAAAVENANASRPPEWNVQGMSAGARSAGSGWGPAGAATPAGPPEGGWLSAPRTVVRFVRENRAVVVGSSVVVLLALWAATSAATRRKRRSRRRRA